MMKANQYARKSRQLKVLAKKLQNLLNSHKEIVTDKIEKLVIKINVLVKELASVFSQTYIKKILGSVAIVIGLSFSNQVIAQSFAPPTPNPFGLDSTNLYALPVFVDLDDDGDFDVLLGVYDGGLDYFENIGSASNPQFAAVQHNPFGLTPLLYLLQSIIVSFVA